MTKKNRDPKGQSHHPARKIQDILAKGSTSPGSRPPAKAPNSGVSPELRDNPSLHPTEEEIRLSRSLVNGLYGGYNNAARIFVMAKHTLEDKELPENLRIFAEKEDVRLTPAEMGQMGWSDVRAFFERLAVYVQEMNEAERKIRSNAGSHAVDDLDAEVASARHTIEEQHIIPMMVEFWKQHGMHGLNASENELREDAKKPRTLINGFPLS